MTTKKNPLVSSPVEEKLRTSERLFNCAFKMGLSPQWVIPKGLFVVTTDKGERYINHSLSNLNSQVAASLSKNKYVTRVILDRHNLPNIPYTSFESLEHAENFLAKHGSIIVKPLRGSGSVGINIVSNREQLAALDITNCILEKYIPGTEMRYLVLNNSVIGVHQSKYGDSVDEHRKLERLSYASDSWDPKLVDMSIKISNILGLASAAVDYIIDSTGTTYVLEVNSTPGFKWFHAPTEGPVVDVAKYFLDAMISADVSKATT